jgi:MraZ protein
MLVPSDVRRQLVPERDGEALYLVMGTDGRLCMYPELHYEELATRDPSELTPDLDTLAYIRMNVGTATKIEVDKQGRVLLPDRVLKRARIDKEVTLVGAIDHLELWQRSDWQAYRDELDTRRAELSLKARQARRTSPPKED